MWKRFKMLVLVSVLFIGAACVPSDMPGVRAQAKRQPLPASGEDGLAPASNPPEKKEAYEMLVTDDQYTLSLYEPPDGCYLGAYILSNKKVSFDIEAFEKLVAKPHGIYMYNMRVGDYFPVNWVLSCVANMKTPYVALQSEFPVSEDGWALLEETAVSFGEFYVPMFVEFNVVDKSVSAKDYVAAYRKARELFRLHASNVAFVWSVDMEDASVCLDYYPGDDYTDWVGINVIESLDPDRPYKGDALEAVDAFYGTFHKQKPVMVSRLAVSHMSSSDYVYQTGPAAEEIKRLYDAFSNDYSRIKAVVVMDFDGINMPSARAAKDNFTVTGEEKIRDAYNQAVAARHFISELAVSSAGDFARAVYTSPFTAYKIGDSFYVSEQSLRLDLGVSDVGAFGEEKRIEGERYRNVAGDESVMARVKFRRILHDGISRSK